MICRNVTSARIVLCQKWRRCPAPINWKTSEITAPASLRHAQVCRQFSFLHHCLNEESDLSSGHFGNAHWHDTYWSAIDRSARYRQQRNYHSRGHTSYATSFKFFERNDGWSDVSQRYLPDKMDRCTLHVATSALPTMQEIFLGSLNTTFHDLVMIDIYSSTFYVASMILSLIQDTQQHICAWTRHVVSFNSIQNCIPFQFLDIRVSSGPGVSSALISVVLGRHEQKIWTSALSSSLQEHKRAWAKNTLFWVHSFVLSQFYHEKTYISASSWEHFQ